MTPTPHALSVKEINKQIKETLEKDCAFQEIWIRGEISNFTRHSSGHLYFSLKEDGSVLKGVMFTWMAKHLTFSPKNGDKVLVQGSISVYEAGGNYQITAKAMIPDGIGSLHLAFEKLKQKLQEEGLFDEARKRPLPPFPKVIGVVTSPTGAVIRDISTTLERRHPLAEIILSPAIVQGEQAPHSICTSLTRLIQSGLPDVIIIGRGGGSIEDLWAFNHEDLARLIFSSPIPIISAVGHETDFTIADFVADRRAPTPTAAAEMAACDLREIQSKIAKQTTSLTQLLSRQIKAKREQIARWEKTLLLLHPQKRLEASSQRLDMLSERLIRAMRHRLTSKQKDFELLITKLEGQSPLSIMKKGYSLVYHDDKLVHSQDELAPGQMIMIRFADGTRTAEIRS